MNRPRPQILVTYAHTIIDMKFSLEGQRLMLPASTADDDACYHELFDLPFVDQVDECIHGIVVSVWADHPSKLMPSNLVEMEKQILEIIGFHARRVSDEEAAQQRLDSNVRDFPAFDQHQPE